MSMQEIVESKSRRENNAAGLPPTAVTPPPLTSMSRLPTRSAVTCVQSALTVTFVASCAAHVVADAAISWPPVSVSLIDAACTVRQSKRPPEGDTSVALAATGGGGGGVGEEPPPLPPQAASDATATIIEPIRDSSYARRCEESAFNLDTP
jgi:hypothetical protein